MGKRIILFGGLSKERLVSVASAQHMAQNLAEASLWFWDKFGAVFEVSYEELLNHKESFVKEFVGGKKIFPDIEKALSHPDCASKIFLLALHGEGAEDGFLQEVLEKNNLVFTGSDSKSSRLAFDKIQTKKKLEGVVKMAPGLSLSFNDYEKNPNIILEHFSLWGPMILKPAKEGSSFGIIRVNSKEDCFLVPEELKKEPNKTYLLEKIIFGRELSVGVFEDEEKIIPLEVTEIVTQKGFVFDYKGKYLGENSVEITPANIPVEIKQKAQKIAVTAHKLLKLYGYSRTDMIYQEDGEIFFLEINNLPGLSEKSIIPQQLAFNGVSFLEFLEMQVSKALKRNFKAK